MDKQNKSDDLFDAIDHYLSQSKVFVDVYLANLGLTHDDLSSMSEEHASQIRRDAFDYAAAQIARLEAMIRLGQRDTEEKPETSPHRRHGDRLSPHFNWYPK